MNFELIEEKRKQRGLTILQFCKEIGVDESTYYKWRDNPDRMKFSTVRQIIDVLGMTKKESARLLQ